MKKIIVFLSVILFNNLYSQTTFSGAIKDDKEKLIDDVFVLIYEEQTQKFLEKANSNDLGSFSFKNNYYQGVYLVEVQRIGYEKKKQTIVVATNEKKEVTLKFSLKLSSISNLKEIVVTTQQPIVVKKDTIIYDIKHFSGKHDESLEAVLSKIEGFKIQQNGDIEVNGKVIRKVLIDGKEVSDFGSALISKSLNPDKVASVEVRFDEKNKKIKESLLNDEKFVVLDIKLKENVSKTFFGRQSLTTGYQSDFEIGGLTNLFSLSEKINIQFFAENNNFGRNTIQLSQIRNIGDESSAKMFSLPVDIDDIKQRTGYQEEIYGFDNFIKNDNSILGLSLSIPLSKKTDLYLGSFNAYSFIKNQSSNQLFFDQDLINDFKSSSYSKEYNSKNKIQLKHTSSKIKINSDVNYVYFKQDLNNEVINYYTSSFEKFNNTNNVYINNNLEYLITEKWGLTSSFSYNKEKFRINNSLLSNDLTLQNYLNLIENENYFQDNINSSEMINKKLNFTYKTEKLGNHSLGYKYSFNSLINEKKSNSVAFNSIGNFKYKANQNAITYSGFVLLDKFNFSFNSEFTFFNYPILVENKYIREEEKYFQYDFKANYEYNIKTNFSFIFSKKLDYYPLQKTTFGNVLMDFQTIFIPNQLIEPYFNQTLSASFYKTFLNKDQLDIAFLRGISNNLNNQKIENNLIFINSNQLRSDYYALSTIYTKKFRKIPLQIILEPEFLINSSEFIIDDEIESTESIRYLTGLKINYKPNKRFSINYFPKYSHFIFKNSISTSKKDFNFLQNTINIKSFFFESKMALEVNYKQVDFFQSKSSFNNLDMVFVYKTNKFRCFMNLNNLFNSNVFLTQDFSQNILNVNNNTVFERFVNFGFEFKIN